MTLAFFLNFSKLKGESLTLLLDALSYLIKQFLKFAFFFLLKYIFAYGAVDTKKPVPI
jgi:hypothetical protein